MFERRYLLFLGTRVSVQIPVVVEKRVRLIIDPPAELQVVTERIGGIIPHSRVVLQIEVAVEQRMR